MRALERFEELLEEIIERSLIGLLGGQLQPVELARRLGRALESQRAIGIGQAYAPNDFVIYLSIDDHKAFETIKGALQRELASYVVNLATERRLALYGPPSVRLVPEQGLGRRQIHVEARLSDRPLSGCLEVSAAEMTQRFSALPGPSSIEDTASVVDLAGRDVAKAASLAGSLVLEYTDGRHILDRPATHAGRALDNDIVIDDSRVSRYHAEFRLELHRCRVRDLHSTNGTFVNSRQVDVSTLRPGDVISLGGFELQLVLVD